VKDFDKRLAELGKWVYPQGPKSGDKPPKYVLNQPKDRDKPRCNGQYPFCMRSLHIHYHTITNAKAPKHTAAIKCKICNRGGVVNVAQWREDVAKSKKSE